MFSQDLPNVFLFTQGLLIPSRLHLFLINFTQTHTITRHIVHLCVCVPWCKRLCLSIAMSSGDHVIRPRPSGRTITECVCVCVRVLAAGLIAIRVQGEGMVGNQEFQSTILARAFHMSVKMNGNPFPLRKITNSVKSWIRTTYLQLCLNTIRFIRKDYSSHCN